MDTKSVDDNIEIYILTHKKIDEPFDSNLYKPILNGSVFLNQDFGYIRDDTGQNISRFNPYFAELTGQYWVWKNSKAEIIGFCHYRRWFAKSIFLKKLNKKDIEKDLKKYDIILPQKTRLKNSLLQTIKDGLEKNPNYGASLEDYYKLGNYIKENKSSYYNSYKKVLNGKELYNNNMFICYKELADNYFNWLFSIFDGMKNEINLSEYDESNRRVYGFLSEFLLSVFIERNDLRVKEHYVYLNERKIPLSHLINRRFPSMIVVEEKIVHLINKL